WSITARSSSPRRVNFAMIRSSPTGSNPGYYGRTTVRRIRHRPTISGHQPELPRVVTAVWSTRVSRVTATGTLVVPNYSKATLRHTGGAMTVVVDDPLIAGMAIRRPLALHESRRRLRELPSECPRVYGVAVMGDLSRRRWWPLAEALTTDRLKRMFDLALEETDSHAAVAQQLPATL